MKDIFLSYRRSDSRETTGRIYDSLIESFGDDAVFRDIDSIPITNMRFSDFLEGALAETQVVLVIIGPTWTSVTNEQGVRRLHAANDSVRMEVETALRMGKPVVPVLVGNAELPRSDELPPSLSELTLRNALQVRPDPDFHNDMTRLTERLGTTRKRTNAKSRSWKESGRHCEIHGGTTNF